MRKTLIAAASLAAAAIPGCTSVTNIHYHGDGKPDVVHDTVYVEHGSTTPGTSIVEPDTLVTPVPGETVTPPTGRVSWIEALDPGTATVETIIDYDLGLSSHRMIGNLLSESGLRLELNVMVHRSESTGTEEYWLIPVFLSSRDWDALRPETSLQGSGRIAPGTSVGSDPTSRENPTRGAAPAMKEVSGRPGAAAAEPGAASSAGTGSLSSTAPVLLLRVDGVPYELTDMADFDCEAHATMLYGVTVRIPVTAEWLEILASGSNGSIEIRNAGGTIAGTLTEDCFTNFRTFFRTYM